MKVILGEDFQPIRVLAHRLAQPLCPRIVHEAECGNLGQASGYLDEGRSPRIAHDRFPFGAGRIQGA